MSVNQKITCSWSGGKDSCYALMKAMEEGQLPAVILNVMNEDGVISRSHGLPLSILQQQAGSIGIPLYSVSSSWKDYESKFVHALGSLKDDYQIEAVVFGDIDLDAHRDWEEKVCALAGLRAILPLWKRPRKALMLEMLENGIKTVIVSCNLEMGENFPGRLLDHALISELEARNIDVCGEDGEFHTVVTDCPLFKQPIVLPAYTTVRKDDYWFLQFE